jgi:hypothetical protein
MQTNPFAELSLQQLKRAVAIRERIESLQRDLNRIVGGQSSPARSPAPAGKRRKLSAAARAKISARMKARWAKFRAQKRGK